MKKEEGKFTTKTHVTISSSEDAERFWKDLAEKLRNDPYYCPIISYPPVSYSITISKDWFKEINNSSEYDVTIQYTTPAGERITQEFLGTVRVINEVKNTVTFDLKLKDDEKE